jgi:hypothetical protein
MIDKNAYLSGLQNAYRFSPSSFSEEDIDFIEKRLRNADIPFNRDLGVSEQSVGSVANQFVSGVVEGFTTLGWADEADTTAEGLANKVGHLIGLAPDVISGVLSMGASLPATIAKRTAGKAAGKAVAKTLSPLDDAAKYIDKKLSDTAQSIKLGKEGKEVMPFARPKDPLDPKKYGFQLRSVPMRAADFILDNASASLGKTGLASTGFLSKGLFKNKKFRKIAHDSLHLGVGLGVSAWKEGPKGMAETAMHGAIAGMVFSSTSEFVNIGKLLANPKTQKLGEAALRRKASEAKEAESVMNLFARGAVGSAYTGGTATYQGAPLPDQVYEYLLGFFFGASGRSTAEREISKYITKKPMSDPLQSIDVYKKELTKGNDYQKLVTEHPSAKDYISRHLDAIAEQQRAQLQQLGGSIQSKFVTKAKEKNYDITKLTKEQHKELSKEIAGELEVDSVNEKTVDHYVDQAVKDADLSKKIRESLGSENFQNNILSYEDLLSRLSEKDVNEHVITQNEMLSLYKQINNKYPSLSYERFSGDLLNTATKYNNNFEQFSSVIKQTYPDVKFRNRLKTFFRRKESLILPDRYIIEESGALKKVGFREQDRDTDVNSNSIIDRYTEAKINKRYGPDTISVLDFVEVRNTKTNEMQKEKALEYFMNRFIGPDEQIKREAQFKDLKENMFKNKNKYLSGSAKDTGNLIFKDILTKDFTNEQFMSIAKVMEKNGLLGSIETKTLTDQQGFKVTLGNKTRDIIDVEMINNALYDMMNNGIITQSPRTLTPEQLRTATETLNTKLDSGEILNSPIKRNKYRGLDGYGKDIPLNYSNFKKFFSLEKERALVPKIISGMQSGADIAGLRAAEALGIPTGGSGTKGHISEVGKTPKERAELAKRFNIEEGQSTSLPERTMKNVDDAGATIAFRTQPSTGTDKTIGYAQTGRWQKGNTKEGIYPRDKKTGGYRNLLVLNSLESSNKNIELIKEFIRNYAAGKPINIAGSRESSVPGSGKKIQALLEKSLSSSSTISDIGTMKVFRLKDRKEGRYELETAEDGSVYVPDSFFKAVKDYVGAEKTEGMLKPLFNISAKEGKGQIIGKALIHSAKTHSKELNDFLEATNGIAGRSTAWKLNGGLKEYTVAELLKEKNPDFTKMKPDELGINPDVRESVNKNQNVKLYKQFSDKNTSMLFSEQFFKDFGAIKEANRLGDPEITKKFVDSIGKEKVFTEFQLDQIGTDVIFETLSTSLNAPQARQLLKKFIELKTGDNQLNYTLLDANSTADALTEYYRTNQVLDSIKNNDYSISYITQNSIRNYLYKALGDYVVSRDVKINVKHGFDSTMYPYTRALERQFQLKDNEFLLGDLRKNDPVTVEGKGTMKLVDVFEAFKKMPKGSKDYEVYKDALTYAIMRIPNASTYSIRIMELKGFAKDAGYGIINNTFTDYMLGGADKDADKVTGYQSLPSSIKKQLGRKEIQYGFNVDKDPSKNILPLKQKEVADYFFGANTENPNRYGVNLATYKDLTTKAGLYNTGVRMLLGESAYIGKRDMGKIVNGGVQMNMMFDIMKQNGGKIDLDKGITFEILPDKDIMSLVKQLGLEKQVKTPYDFLQLVNSVGLNVAADSATFGNISNAGSSLTRMFNAFFTIKKDGVEVPRTAKFRNYYDLFKTEYEYLAPGDVKVKSSTEYGTNAMLSMREWSRALEGKTPINELQQQAETFLKYWNVSNEGTNPKNYLVENARILSSLPKVEWNSMSLFNYVNPENVAIYLERTTKALQGSSVLKELGVIDYYRKPLTQKELDLIRKSDYRLYEKVRETVGNDLFIRSAERMLTVLEASGMTREQSRNLVQKIVSTTYTIKQADYLSKLKISEKDKQKTSFDTVDNIKTDVPNTFDMTTYMLYHKRSILNLVRDMQVDKQLKRGMEDIINEVIDFSYLSAPILTPELNKVQSKLAQRLLDTYKEMETLAENVGADRDHPQFADLQHRINKVHGISTQLVGSYQKLHQNPTISPRSLKKYNNAIDSILAQSQEKIKADQQPKQLKTAEEIRIVAEEQRQEIDRLNDIKVEVHKPILGLESMNDILRSDKISDYGKEQVRRYKDFFNENPGVAPYLDLIFETVSGGLNVDVKTGKPFAEATARDLDLFMTYMERKATPGLLVKLMYTKDMKPSKLAQLFFPESLEAAEMIKVMKGKSSNALKNGVEFPLVDKDKQIILKKGMIPTTLLSYNTDVIYGFHQINNGAKEFVKKEIEEKFDFLEIENGLIGTRFDIIFEYTMASREYNNGNFYSKTIDPLEKSAITENYNRFQAEFDVLVKEGKTYQIMDAEATKGQKKKATVNELSELINNRYTDIMTNIYDNVIKSHYPALRKKLIALGKSVDQIERIIPKNATDIEKSMLELDKLFLDKNGLLSDYTKINAMFAGVRSKSKDDFLQFSRELPSQFDAQYIDYYKMLNNVLQIKYPKIDFTKPLEVGKNGMTKKLFNNIMRDVKDIKSEYKPDKYIAIGRFINLDSGRVENYVPHTDPFGTEANRTKNTEFINKQIEVEKKRIGKDPTKLHPQSQFKLQNAKDALYKNFEGALEHHIAITIGQKYDFYNLKGINLSMDLAEQSAMDLLNRKPMQFMRTQYSNMQKRGSNPLPGYDLTFNHLQRYADGMYRSWFNTLASINVGNNIERFERLKPFGTKDEDIEVMESWSAFYRDVAVNQMGMPSLRNYSVHGIRQKELKLLQDYIDNNGNMNLYGSQKRFIESVSAQQGLDVLQKIEVKRSGKEGASKRLMEKELLLKNLKKLAQQKNVNKINRFGSFTDLYSDEAFVGFVERMNDNFGGNWLDNAPKTGKARQMYIARKAQQLSNLEGKFEMMSLLFHPRTFLGNIYGGSKNLLTDVSWSTVRKATSEKYMIDNIFKIGPDKFIEYEITNADGTKSVKSIKSLNDWFGWQTRTGIFEDIFSQQNGYDSKLLEVGSKRALTEFIKRMLSNTDYMKMNDIDARRFHDATWKDIVKEFKLSQRAANKGAFFMQKSEMILRGASWTSGYLKGREILGEAAADLPFNHPILIDFANKTVKASQFIYHASERPNFANTAIGRIMTRFHPFGWNSIRRTIDVYKGGAYERWKGGMGTERAQKQLTADLFALALGSIFVSSIFEYAMAPPYNWLQDTASLLFGDDEARDRAFYSPYPHPVLAPLTIVTPPISRFILPPITSLLENDFENFWKYQFSTYLPFGRALRDTYRTVQSPAMFVEFSTGIPLHQFHTLSRDTFFNKDEELEEDDN